MKNKSNDRIKKSDKKINNYNLEGPGHFTLGDKKMGNMIWKQRTDINMATSSADMGHLAGIGFIKDES